MPTTDFLVVGGGIIGISIARELRHRHPDRSVTVLEKEPACGLHASGRNSGVLHAGFYYTADSLKARFTRDGNRALAAYCDAKGLPINRCGKLVVARTAADHPQMDELLRRGAANGVELESITEAEAGCKVHVALHGCVQSAESVGNRFYTETGYNRWADSNRMLVLYPQVNQSALRPYNPKGCWDWWGYSGSQYAYKSAPQMKAIMQMVDRLTQARTGR